MMNGPVKLFMLFESEGSAVKNDLVSAMSRSYFDWATLYAPQSDSSSTLSFTEQIQAQDILTSSEKMGRILAKNFNQISELRTFQKQALDALILSKQNVFVQNYTGSGKSLLFQLYAMFHAGLTVVISPFVAITLGEGPEPSNLQTRSRNLL